MHNMWPYSKTVLIIFLYQLPFTAGESEIQQKRWHIVRYGEKSSEPTQPHSVPDGTEILPVRLKKLYIPSPQTEKNKFFNDVFIEIYQM